MFARVGRMSVLLSYHASIKTRILFFNKLLDVDELCLVLLLTQEIFQLPGILRKSMGVKLNP